MRGSRVRVTQAAPAKSQSVSADVEIVMANIYIQVEVSKREWDAKLLLAMTAAARGHRVLLGHVKPFLKTQSLPQGIILDKSLTPSRKKIIEMMRAKKNKHLFTAIDEETGILSAKFESFAKFRFSKKTIELADAIFFWGPFDYSYISENFPEYTSKLYKTGNARLDLWRPEMKSLFSSQSQKPNSYFLIVSNLGGAMAKRSYTEEWTQYQKSTSLKITEAEKEQFDRHWEYTEKMAASFKDALNALSHKFPDYNFILRPHPTESDQKWKDLLDSRENIIINSEGPISSWLRNANAIIHCGCTSAIEVALAEIPIISCVPDGIKHEVFQYPNRLGVQAQSLNVLIEKIENHKNIKADTLEQNQKILNERIYLSEKKLACEEIVDVWDSLSNTSSLTMELIERHLWKKPINLVHKFDIYKILNNSITRYLNLNSTVEWKFPVLSPKKIEKQMNTYRSIFGRFDDVQVKYFGPRLCMLEIKNES